MSVTKHKILSSLIITFVSFFGFEAINLSVSIYQLKTSLYLSFWIYAFHIFWLTLIFDLHFKNRGAFSRAKSLHSGLKLYWEAFKDRFSHLKSWPYFRHYQNYLVLPGILYWSTITLILINPFKPALKTVVILGSTIALSVTYWYMKEHVSRRLEHNADWIKILSLAKLLAAFLVYSSLLGVTFIYGESGLFLFAGSMALTFLLIYQALFQHRLLNFEIFLWVGIIAFIQGLVSLWVYMNWNTEYFTGGLVMLAVYNTLWGLLHHHLDHNLNKKIVIEYSLMTIFVISYLLLSHNFHQRVI